MMNLINYILDDFFNCFNVPIKVISSNGKILYQVGSTSYFDSLYPNDKLKNLIENNDMNLLDELIHVGNNIYFSLVSLSRFNRGEGYFVIGPFTTDINTSINLSNIPYKSLSASSYLSKFILEICDDKFSKGISSKNINPYVRRAIEYVHHHYDEDISIDVLCDEYNINKCYFCKVFKKDTGFTFTNFVNSLRIEKSKKLLVKSNLSLLDIAVSVGFNNQNYYTMAFKKFIGQTPSQYRQLSKVN